MALKGFENLYDYVFVTIFNSFNNKTRQNVSKTKTCGILGMYKSRLFELSDEKGMQVTIWVAN